MLANPSGFGSCCGSLLSAGRNDVEGGPEAPVASSRPGDGAPGPWGYTSHPVHGLQSRGGGWQWRKSRTAALVSPTPGPPAAGGPSLGGLAGKGVRLWVQEVPSILGWPRQSPAASPHQWLDAPPTQPGPGHSSPLLAALPVAGDGKTPISAGLGSGSGAHPVAVAHGRGWGGGLVAATGLLLGRGCAIGSSAAATSALLRPEPLSLLWEHGDQRHGNGP